MAQLNSTEVKGDLTVSGTINKNGKEVATTDITDNIINGITPVKKIDENATDAKNNRVSVVKGTPTKDQILKWSDTDNAFVPYTLNLTSAGFPGQITMGANINAPLGWLKCDGAAYDRVDYPNLYEVIGDTYNKPETTVDKFCVPDLAGKYVMGADAENAVGSNIEESLPSHSHAYTDPGHTHIGRMSWGSSGGDGMFAHSGGTENWRQYLIQNITNITIDGVNNTYNEAGEKVPNDPATPEAVYKNGAKVRPDSVVLNYFIKY